MCVKCIHIYTLIFALRTRVIDKNAVFATWLYVQMYNSDSVIYSGVYQPRTRLYNKDYMFETDWNMCFIALDIKSICEFMFIGVSNKLDDFNFAFVAWVISKVTPSVEPFIWPGSRRESASSLVLFCLQPWRVGGFSPHLPRGPLGENSNLLAWRNSQNLQGSDCSLVLNRAVFSGYDWKWQTGWRFLSVVVGGGAQTS